MSTVSNNPNQTRTTLMQWDEYILGGLGAVCAGFFTNPLEVVKTRIQLQGELRARGHYTVHYRNVFHAFYAMAKAESLLSLQKGLTPALYYQFIMNGCRFGAYQAFDNLGFTRNSEGDVVLYRSIACGVSSGLLGSFLGSPFYLVKTHLQTRSDSAIAVGHQHQHSSMTEGFRKIFRQYGITGLWRGAVASMTRVVDADKWYGTLLCSTMGSCLVVSSMTPFDVVSTRLYNQPVDPKTGKGQLYRGIFDCMAKIFRTEGFLGFYKGFSASFLRLGPHTVLSIFFWQQLRKEYLKRKPKSSDDLPSEQQWTKN